MASGSGKDELPPGEPPLPVRVMQKLRGADLTRSFSSSTRIFKVPNQLRQINEKAYEPEVISIGPYHRGKHHLKAMEDHKLHHLRRYLDLENDSPMPDFMKALEELEKREGEARRFYSEPLAPISRADFVEMMLLDGCFIIGLTFWSKGSNDTLWSRLSKDFLTPILTHFTLRKVMRDLLLLENQLPFFVLSVLCPLFQLHYSDVVIDICFKWMASLLIKERVQHEGNTRLNEHELYQRLREQDAADQYLLNHHLLDSLRAYLRLLHELQPTPTPKWQLNFRCDYLCLWHQSQPTPPKWQFIRSATELREAGIKFQKNSGVLYDIKFQNGLISIPALTIDDNTESILRNLVAYEQCYQGISSKRFKDFLTFTDYITFMDCLVNTGKDVELLCGVGVLENRLGDYEVVAAMFNRLRASVWIFEEHFSYEKIFIGVNEHCNRECNKQMATLRHDYYHNPGAFISFTSSTFLFLCSLSQTLFSILSYHHQAR